jgi:hypothetical protein
MLTLSIISLLAGAALEQRFKVLILAPAILLTILIGIGAATACLDAAWTVGAATAVAIAGLQMGYILGIAFRCLIGVRTRRLRTISVGGP